MFSPVLDDRCFTKADKYDIMKQIVADRKIHISIRVRGGGAEDVSFRAVGCHTEE